MALNTNPPKTKSLPNGATSVFPFNFKILDAAHVKVAYFAVGEVLPVIISPTDYTVAGVGVDAGGTITLTATYLAANGYPASGSKLYTYRDTPKSISTGYIEGNPFPATTAQRDFERVMMAVQELQEELGYSQSFDEGTTFDVPDNSVTNTALADMPASTIKGNNSVNPGDPLDLTATQVKTLLALQNVDNTSDLNKPYNLSVTGSVARTIVAALKERPSIKDFGAVGDNSTDDTAAITAMVSAANAGLIKSIYFPPGDYKNTGTHSITASGFSITGAGARSSVIHHTADTNLLTFTSTSPTSARIDNITMRDMGLYHDRNNPGTGVMLTLIRTVQSRFTNVEILGAYKGLEIYGGGAGLYFSDLSVYGSGLWSALKTGSYTVFLDKYGSGVNELPSEIFFQNCNLKGATNTNNYLQNSVVVKACDGVHFTNSHIGFVDAYDVYVEAQNDATASIMNLKFHNCYFDGNDTSLNNAGAGIAVSGSTTPAVRDIELTGCDFSNHKGHGFQLALSTCSGFKVQGGTCRANRAWGGIISGGVNVSVVGVNFINNNLDNVGANALSVADTTRLVVTSNQFSSGTNAHPVAVAIGNNVTGIVTQNLFSGNTSNITCTSTTGMYINGNFDVAGYPTVASATSITLPLGFDVIKISGTTTINTITAANILGMRVTLMFTGACAVGDEAGNVSLAGAFTSTAGSTLSLVHDSTNNWREAGRGII